VDLVRGTLYCCSLVPPHAVFLISQGMIQNFKPYENAARPRADDRDAPRWTPRPTAKGREGNPITEKQVVETRPSCRADGLSGGDQDARDQRGGYRTPRLPPVREPDAAVNFLQIFSIFLIPSGLLITLDAMVKNPKHGWSVWGAMAFCSSPGAPLLVAEAAGNSPARARS